MKKRVPAFLLACTLIAATLSGCTGHSGEAAHSAHGNSVQNLALGKPAAQNLSESSKKDAKKAVDGDVNTYYTSKGDSGTIEIDFGGTQTFNTVILREKGWNVRQYHLEALVKGDEGEERWNTIYIGERIEDLRYCALEESVTASKLRLVVDSASQIFSIREIEVNQLQPLNREPLRVSAYVRTDLLLDGSLLDQKANAHIDPKYLDVVTELNLIGCVSATKDGTITIERTQTGADGKEESVPVTDAQFQSALNSLRRMIGDRKVQLTMTIYVGTPEDALASMTQNRDALVKNTMAFLEKFDLDGLSYDWERPQNQEQFDAFSDYLIALRPQLTSAGKRLTLAWAAWGVHMKEEAVKTADAIEIMSYDLFDQYGNQASFMESTVQAVDYFLSLGYQPEQLNLGIPYYGRPENGGEFWPSYNDARYHLGRYDDTDSEYVASYGKCYFNSYQTVMDKTAYAISRGIGGVMVFRLELDRPYDDEVSLTKAIGNTIRQRVAQP